MNILSLILSIAFAITTYCNALSSTKVPPINKLSSSRRNWICKSIISATSITSILVDDPSMAIANSDVDTLPNELKQYTALAPLGNPTSTGDKVIGSTLEELAKLLSKDLVEGSTGKGGYFVSGDMSTQIFRDDCQFIDPTNSVSSLSRYQNALRILFDPNQSYVKLLEPLIIDESKNMITARIESGGVLKLPWKPKIPSYESSIIYKVDSNGLIESQIQEWSISASQALKETFTP